MTELDLKVLAGVATAHESREYLKQNGVDPDEVTRHGLLFVRAIQGKIALENKVKEMYSEKEVIALCNKLYSAMTTDSTYDGVWLDSFFETSLK